MGMTTTKKISAPPIAKLNQDIEAMSSDVAHYGHLLHPGDLYLLKRRLVIAKAIRALMT
jgi:hypothetical protein